MSSTALNIKVLEKIASSQISGEKKRVHLIEARIANLNSRCNKTASSSVPNRGRLRLDW